MKLKKIIKDIPIRQVKGSKEIEITGICSNSKLVAPGNLFIARRGLVYDGNRYIPEAISAGASAVLTDIYDPTIKITQLIHPSVKEMEGLIANEFYQSPSKELFLVGITGTNGKTTTAFLVKHVLDKLYGTCGLIGTIEYIIGEHHFQATRTTPDVTDNHKMLREMVQQKCRSAVMEVTSHALEQGRLNQIEFDVGIFTNLTLDHLDYHLTMENYCKSKNKLFTSLKTEQKKNQPFQKMAIVNIDDPWHKKMTENCRTPILSFSLQRPADIYATKIQLSPQGTHFDVAYRGKNIPCFIPLVGRYNVYNALGALALGLHCGADLQTMTDILSSFRSVSGRLEPVQNSLGLKIYVDFAHSDDALANVLSCLKEFKKGRIITVFGCGGDRDATKRPKMGEVSETLSDFTIVTSDNPRSEDPAKICQEIVTGFKSKDRLAVELDRKSAIKKAIQMATKEDIILIAGKGHETQQIFSHKIIEFDDRKIAAQLCETVAKS